MGAHRRLPAGRVTSFRLRYSPTPSRLAHFFSASVEAPFRSKPRSSGAPLLRDRRIFCEPNCCRTTVRSPISATSSPSAHASSASGLMSWRRIRKLQPLTPSTSFNRRATCSPVIKVTATPPRISVKVVSNGCERRSSVVFCLSSVGGRRLPSGALMSRTPGDVVDDAEDGGGVYLELGRQGLHADLPWNVAAPDFCDLPNCQLGGGVLLPAQPRSVLHQLADVPLSASLHLPISSVVCRCPKEQMIWPDASRVVATVTNEQSVRDGTIKQQPCEAVGGVSLSRPANLSISLPLTLTSPFPALARSIDALPKA